MPVMATQTNGETNQAVGSLAQILYGVESTWGVAPAAASRTLRLLPGETLDQNFAVYQSRQLRPDRMENPPVIGSQDPGGNIPFELSPNGWNNFLYHLLLPTVITQASGSGGLSNPSSAPTGTSASSGFIPAGTYYYVYTAYNATGETLPSPVSSGIVLSATGSIAITLTTVTSAVGYNIYRSTASGGPFYRVGTTTTTSFTDSSASGGNLAPTYNSTGSSNQFIIKAGTTGTPLPIGFSLEKGFMDLGNVFGLFQGCRVDKGTFRFRTDAICDGTFDIIARQCTWNSTTAFSNGLTPPTLPNDAPYDGAYIAMYEGSQALPAGVASGTPLGLCNDFSLTVDNAYYKRNGFILGSTLRQNLKAGTRKVTFSGRFMFQDMSLYNKAINATNSSIKIVCTSGNYSHIFDMPTVRFTPNSSSPKISNDGPIEVQFAGRAEPDSTIGTNLQVTIITDEGSITN